MKLRLLLLEKCNRTCKGCCNKEYDLHALPVCHDFSGYSEVLLTGGEPLLVPEVIRSTVDRIRLQNPTAPIILYTAWRENASELIDMLAIVDGITLTLHTRKDVEPFLRLNKLLRFHGWSGKSLRLNVFRGISLGDADVSAWSVKSGITWIKDLHLPEGEVFMRLDAI